MGVEQILKDRNATHGDFREGAKTSQHLKKVVTAYEKNLSVVQKESLDMIMHKIARILNGDPRHIDAWSDIIGYSTLAIRDIEETKIEELKDDAV